MEVTVVLLAEDDEDCAKVFSFGIKCRLGCEVIVADNADMAVKRIEKGGIDVVLTDWNLPGGGATVAEAAREASVPVGVCSGSEREEVEIDLPWLRKPCGLDEIVALVEKLLSARLKVTDALAG